MHVLVLKCMKTAINHRTVGKAQHLDTLGPWSGIKLTVTTFYQFSTNKNYAVT